jgi:cobalamin biosynthesis protein CobT
MAQKLRGSDRATIVYLKENIDGEALIWAHDRLRGRPEQRHILTVISCGGSGFLDSGIS